MADTKNFGKRLTEIRKSKDITREALSKKAKVSYRTLFLYEQGERYPNLDIAQRIADALEVSVSLLIGEEGEIMERARKEYGSKGVRDLNEIREQVNALFAGGELPEEDKDELMQAFTEAYFIAKQKNRKYTPKKYRKDDEEY